MEVQNDVSRSRNTNASCGFLPQIKNSSFESVASSQSLSEESYRDVILLFHRTLGSARISYLAVDAKKKTSLQPKLLHVTWPRMKYLTHYQAVVFQKCLYIIGGKDKRTGKITNKVWKYSPETAKWSECASMRTKRCRFAACVYDGKIHVSGGEVALDSKASDSCEVYEPLINSWMEEEPLPLRRKDHLMLSWRDCMLMVGGNTGNNIKKNKSNCIWVLEKKFPNYHKFGHGAPKKLQGLKPFCYLWSRLEGTSKDLLPEHQDNVAASIWKNIMFIFKEAPLIQQLIDIPAKSEDNRVQNKRQRLDSGVEVTPRSSVTTSIYPDDPVGCFSPVMDSESSTRAEVDFVMCQCHPTTQTRHNAGVANIGSRVYLIGGHNPHDSSSPIQNVEYYHIKKKKWCKSFSLGKSDSITNVFCCVLRVPVNNMDFKRESEALTFQWPMW